MAFFITYSTELQSITVYEVGRVLFTLPARAELRPGFMYVKAGPCFIHNRVFQTQKNRAYKQKHTIFFQKH